MLQLAVEEGEHRFVGWESEGRRFLVEEDR